MTFTLNFSKHIDFVYKVTSHKIYVLSKLRKYIEKYTALYLYKSMICPIFDYGDISYEEGNQEKLDKLKRTQNRGLKVCLNIDNIINTIQLHQFAGIPQLQVRRASNLKKYMYLQQNNTKYVVHRDIPTQAHHATIFETCIPKIEKHKKRLYL